MKTRKGIILFVIVLVMLNNVEHLAWVHYDLAKHVFPVFLFDWLNKVHSVAVVIIFEIVVITFVMEGRKGFSMFFTGCIWVLSMIYYDAPQLYIEEEWEKLIAATVYSTIFTISIYMFAEMLADWYQGEDRFKLLNNTLLETRSQLEAAQSQLQVLHASGKQADADLNKARSSIDAKDRQIDQLQRTIEEYRRKEEEALKALQCPYCGEQKTNEGELRSHKGHCLENPINKNA